MGQTFMSQQLQWMQKESVLMLMEEEMENS